MERSFGQIGNSSTSFNKAKLSSDQAISLIDSMKGSSLLDSVISGMGNFSSANNASNNTMKGLIDNSTKNGSLFVTNNVTSPINHSKLLTFPSSGNDNIHSNDINIQPLLVLPYPMSIQSKDYIPLYSSMPSKISNGTILTKLPCDNNSKPILQIVGSSSDNNIFPLKLLLIPNLSKAGSMCMYKSVFPDDFSNALYSHTLTNIYLYNTMNTPLEVPTTTTIFIGIHKLSM
ncbi:MAG: hypothetical protein ACTHJ2_10850 [Candidatus Nitrosocosmicus sp.]